MIAWLDGALVAPGDLPPLPAGAVAPFETMGAARGDLPLWDHHLVRLGAAAARLGLPFAPPAALHEAARELLQRNGHRDGVLRLVLQPDGVALRTLLTTRPADDRPFVRLLPAVVPPPAGGPPGDLKALPRAFHDAVRQQARDGGADDGIVIAPDGAVRETAVANLWLCLAGIWVTPALDGAVLPGIARALLLRAAAAAGLRTAERRCDLGDLHRAEALATSNAVHGPRAAQLLGSGPAAVAKVDSELGALWRAAAGSFSR